MATMDPQDRPHAKPARAVGLNPIWKMMWSRCLPRSVQLLGLHYRQLSCPPMTSLKCLQRCDARYT